ncbi:MAG TPA: DUF2652 domain-containing protein [Aquihabitans sp.]|jgi:hypothetical protein|nr:DUF2652 domain-containing protein [Aquihabitans sp.]
MATGRALLLIADIGGYTEYMQYHRSVLGHAEAATSRMLDKVVGAARGFDLVEIEGDAAFLSRDLAAGEPVSIDTVTQAAISMHRAFHQERRLIERNMCPCGSCTKTAELKLKFVAHVGEVATQTIKRRRKLVGVDVIHVHRLLKNPIGVPEYVLVSEDVRGGEATPAEPAMQEITLELEGIGPARSYYLDVGDIAAPPAALPDPTWPQRIGGTLGMVGRGLPHIGRRRRVTASVE